MARTCGSICATPISPAACSTHCTTRTSCGSCPSSSTSSRRTTPRRGSARAAARSTPSTTRRGVCTSRSSAPRRRPSTTTPSSPRRRRRIRILEHFALTRAFREDCDAWAVPALSAIENQAVASEIPTLITNGGYDPVTPLPFGEAAAAGLTTHYLYELPDHGPRLGVGRTGSTTCPASIAEQFLADPSVEPDSSCIAVDAADRLPHHRRHLPDVRDLPVQQRCRRGPRPGADRHRDRVTLVLLLGTLVYALVYGIAWLVRRRGGAPPGAVPAAATAAGLYLVFAGSARRRRD